MRKLKPKKLAFHRDTLRHLHPTMLTGVGGAAWPTWGCTYSCDTQCWACSGFSACDQHCTGRRF